MSLTALQLVQTVAGRIGITQPNALFSSTDQQVVQLRNLLNEEGVELTRDPAMAWTVLMREHTFLSSATEVQTGAIPTDFAWYLNDTLWNRTQMVKASGPASPEQWQTMKAIAIVSLPAVVFRFRNNEMLFYPLQPAGQTCAYEYSSLYWVTGDKAYMTADTDTSVLDDEVLILGVIWRFLRAKGLDYAEAFRTYELAKTNKIARDGGKRKVYLGGGIANPWNANAPWGAWPGPGNT